MLFSVGCDVDGSRTILRLSLCGDWPVCLCSPVVPIGATSFLELPEPLSLTGFISLISVTLGGATRLEAVLSTCGLYILSSLLSSFCPGLSLSWILTLLMLLPVAL